MPTRTSSRSWKRRGGCSLRLNWLTVTPSAGGARLPCSTGPCPRGSAASSTCARPSWSETTRRTGFRRPFARGGSPTGWGTPGTGISPETGTNLRITSWHGNGAPEVPECSVTTLSWGNFLWEQGLNTYSRCLTPNYSHKKMNETEDIW